MTKIRQQARTIAEELCDRAGLQAGDRLVVGCSSSEIVGSQVGSASSPAAAQAALDGIMEVLEARGIFLVAQCCEHLNRALITEKAALHGEEIVNVVPQPKAGGSFATAAYQRFKQPVAIEHVRADAGLDIGSTLIGMHLKEVAVPLRLSMDHIGEAFVTAARTRPRCIGGSRAVYDEKLL